MTSSNIHDHFVKRRFYESLQSTRFCLSRPEALEGLDASRSIPKTLVMIKRRCFQSKATCEETIELRDLVQKVVGDFETITSHWEEYHGVLDAMNRVGVIGAKLLQSERVVTGITTRGPFGPQGHASTSVSSSVSASVSANASASVSARRTFYWLHAPSMDRFEDAIGQLLPYGTLEPFSLSETLEAKESIEMNLLQRILFCYGVGMSQSPPYAVFAGIPVLWKDFMSECADLDRSLIDIRCERNAYMQHALMAALPSLRTLVTEKTGGGEDYVKFQSMFSTDPGIEVLRTAFQNESKWN